MSPREYVDPVPILDGKGRPLNCGWARRPVFGYDRGAIRGPQRRVVESDRYVVFSSTHALSFEVMDGGHLGYISVSAADLRSGRWTAEQYVVPFPLGAFDLSSSGDNVKIRQKSIALDFVAMEGGSRILKIDAPGFGKGRGLRGAVVLTAPADSESISTVMPWRKHPEAFRYTCRRPSYSAEGMMQFGAEEMAFSAGDAWGVLDWNRGLVPGAEVRYWAAGCGTAGSTRLSFSVGYGSADGTGGTENALFVDGRLHKLGQVTFRISPKDWLEPWSFTSDDERFRVAFTPRAEGREKLSVLFHVRKRRLFFGDFSGTVVGDDGVALDFSGLIGVGEQVKARL